MEAKFSFQAGWSEEKNMSWKSIFGSELNLSFLELA